MAAVLRAHAWYLLLALSAPLHAQTTITYVDGQGRGTEVYAPSTLDIASGTATQFGRIFNPLGGGSGSITKTGDGILILADAAHEYTGGTILQGGALQLGFASDFAGSLGPSGTISFEGGALRFSTSNTTDYSARFSTAAGQQYRIDTNSANVSLASAITSAGGTFTKLGAGTLTLSGANSFDGGITFSAGALQLGSTGALGSAGTINFAGGALRYTATNTTDYSARFSTAASQQYAIDTNGQDVTLATSLTSSGGSLIKSGTGTLTLVGDNTYSGATTISSGTLQVGVGGTTGSLAGSVVNNGALVFNRADSFSFAGGISGTGSVTKLQAGTLIVTGDLNYGGGTTISAGTLQIGDGGSAGAIAGNVTNDSALVFNRADSFSVDAAIGGTGSVTYAGSGTVAVFGENTYTGGTTLAGGFLELRSLGALGSTGAISFTGGTLRYGFNSPTTDYSARFATTPGQQYRVETGGLFDDVTYASALTSPGGSLVKTGDRTLILTADSTYTGTTTIAQGRLQLGNGGTAGRVAGPIEIADGALLMINRSDAFSLLQPITGAGRVEIDGGATVGFGAANTYTGPTDVVRGTLILLDGSSLAGELTVLSNGTVIFDGITTFANAINGNGHLIKDGGSTLTLTGDNSFGNRLMTLAGGTLVLGSSNALSNSQGSISFTGGILRHSAANAKDYSSRFVSTAGQEYRIDTAGRDVIYATALTSSGGTLIKEGAGTLTLAANSTYSGKTTVLAGALQIGNGGAVGNLAGLVELGAGTSLIFNRSDSATFSQSIGGLGAVTHAGTGTLTLSGDNGYLGGTNLAAGTILLGHANALGSTGSIAFTGGALRYSAGATTDHSGRIANSTGVIAIDTNGQNVTYASGLAASNTGGLTKSGAGTLILAADSNYSGITTISAGTLQLGNGVGAGSVTGDIINNGSLVINRTGILALAGTVNGTGSLSKNGSGTLVLSGNNTYAGGTMLNDGALELGSAGAIDSVGAITLGGGILRYTAANNTDYSARFSPAAGQQYRIDTNGQNVSLGTSLVSAGGTLEKSGLGTLSTAVHHTFTGATVISAGTLQVGNGGTTGYFAGPISIASGATFAINRSGTYAPAAAITNNGDLTFTGGGTLLLTDALTGSGTTTINSGTLQLNDGGSIANAIVNNASLVFNRSDSFTFGNSIVGTGALTKSGSGVLSLSGNNGYSGGTNVNAGAIALGHANALGSTGAITFGGGTLRYGAGATTDHSARIAGSSSAIAVDTNSQTVTYASALAATNTGGLTKSGPGTLILSGDNNYAGGTTITAGTLQLGNGGNTGSIIGAIVNNGTLAINRTGTFELARDISGTGALTKNGAGILTLSGANTYAGGTTLIAGTLELGSAGAIGSTGVITFNGGTLRFTGANTADYSARFSTSGGQQYRLDTNGQNVGLGTALTGGSLDKLGLGTLSTTVDHTFPGVTTVSAGTLQLGIGGTTGSVAGQISIASGATLAINRSGTYAAAATITNNGDLTFSGGGTLLLTAPVSGGGATTINSGTLQVNDGGSIGNAIVNNASLVFNRATALSHLGTISGTGTLDKNGTGTLTLVADNTYSGLTTVSGGTLRIGNGGSTGSVAGQISLASGTAVAFDRTGTLTHGGVISGGGALTKSGSGTIIFTADNTYTGTTAVSGGVLQLGNGGSAGSVASNITNNGTVAFNRNDNLTYASVISGNGALTKGGAGTLTLTANQTYAGSTTISGGTLQLGNGGSTGSITSSSVSVVPGATFAINRGDNFTSGALIGGGGSFTKAGAGTLTFTANHTYTGGTSVSGGTLQLGSGGGSGSVAGNISVASDATVAFNRSDSLIYSGVISGAGALAKSGSGTLVLTRDNTLIGGTTVAGGTLQIGDYVSLFENTTTGTLAGDVQIALGARLVFFRNENISFDGAITGDGDLSTTGSGILTISGNNSYTGSTTLAAGVLELGSADALGLTSAISFIGGILRHTDANVVDYSASFAAEDQSISIDTNDQDVTYASGFGTLNSSLMKLGAGTLNLTGTNALGYIEVSAGTLDAGSNAALGGSTFISVSAGATLHTSGGATLGNGQALGGNGTISGGFTLGEGAVLYPGGAFSPGGLTFTNGLTLGAGSTVNFDLGSFGDTIVVSGGVLTGPSTGQVTLNLYDAGDFGVGTYTLFDYSAQGLAASFGPASFLLGDTIEGYTYSLDIVGDTLQLTASVVPEPSAASVLLVGLLGLGALRRRRVSNSGA